MPSFKTAFPSKYLKADNLGTTRPVGTIATVGFEEVGTGDKQESKLVVTWREPGLRPMVLNMINAETIAEIAGTDDFEQWPGTRVQLYATKTEFQGKRVPCIRLEAPPAKPRKAAPEPEDVPEGDYAETADADSFVV